MKFQLPGGDVCPPFSAAPGPRSREAELSRPDHSRRHLLPRRQAPGIPNKDGSREFLEACPSWSLIAIAAMPRSPESRVCRSSTKLAVRPEAPLVAKQVQGIRLLSRNRLLFGVGIDDPWEGTAVCDVPWENAGSGDWTERSTSCAGWNRGSSLPIRAGPQHASQQNVPQCRRSPLHPPAGGRQTSPTARCPGG